jgi:hypothetical protein
MAHQAKKTVTLEIPAKLYSDLMHYAARWGYAEDELFRAALREFWLHKTQKSPMTATLTANALFTINSNFKGNSHN